MPVAAPVATVHTAIAQTTHPVAEAVVIPPDIQPYSPPAPSTSEPPPAAPDDYLFEVPAYGAVNEEPPVPTAHQEVVAAKESSAVVTVYSATTDQVQQNIDPVLPSVASPEPPIVAENKPEPLLVDNKQGVVGEDSAVVPADNQWYELLPKLGLGGMAKQFAEHCLFKEQFDDKVVLLLDNTGVTLQSNSTEETLAKSLSQHFGREIHLVFEVSDAIGETPEKRRIRLGKELQQAAEQSIEQDSFVNELREKWGGVVLPGSIRPNLNVDAF